MKHKVLIYCLQFIAIFVLYYITGKYGLDLNEKTGHMNLIWIPGGVALAVLLIYGYRMIPAIFLGIVAISIAREAPFYPSLWIIAATMLEAVLGVYLLRRLKFKSTFESVSDVIKLAFIVTPLISFLSTIPGVLSLLLYRPNVTISITGLTWWSGHFVGILIVTSLVLVWSKRFIITKNIRKFSLELSFLILSVIVYGVLLFTNFFGGANKSLPLIYLAYIPVLWSIFRFNLRTTVTVMSAIASFLIASVYFKQGPFAFQGAYESALSLKSFLTFFSITTLITAVAVSQSRQYEERKDKFISIASHELRTPLTTITIVTQLLQKMHKAKARSKDAVYKESEYLENMNQQTAKMARMINEMLDLSKIQTGRLKLRKEPFSLPSVVKQATDNMRAITFNHKFVLEGTVKEYVVGDKDRISQVVSNLLSNAVKYSPEGKKVVIHMSSHKKHVAVSVQDFGIGIPKERIPHVFERFYRAHEQDELTFSGFGLGLYIASEIIRQHGGRIWVESIQGKGSTFYFTLPV